MLLSKFYNKIWEPFEFKLYRLLFLWSTRLGILDSLHLYQPIPWLGFYNANRRKNTELRWKLIQDKLTDDFSSSLDLGSNTGYFTFKLAEKGLTSIGVEHSGFMYAHSTKMKKICNFTNAAFWKIRLSPSNIISMPSVDVVLCLSVFHAWDRTYGFSKSTDMLKFLISSAKKVLFFETTDPDVIYNSFNDEDPQSTDAISNSIEIFLKDLGAIKVQNIGQTSPNLGLKTKYLFAAYTK